MNKNATLALAILCFIFLGNTNVVQAQINVILPNIDGCPGDVVNIPVLVENFDGIGSITMAIDYDEDALHYTGHVNPNISLASGSFLTNSFDNNGQMQVRASWYWIFPANVGTDTLVELIFEVKCEATSLTFDLATPGVNEITDEFASILTVDYTNGSLSIEDITPTLTAPIDGSIDNLTTPLITWDPASSSCSQTYTIQISEDPSWADLPVVDESGISGTSYTAAGLDPNTQYYCRVGTDSCSAWSQYIAFNTGLSINETQYLSEIITYPNPVSDIVAVEFYLNNSSSVSIHLLDVLGNEIVEKNLSKINIGKHTSVVDLSGVPAGIYLINIKAVNQNNSSNFVKRIIKK